MLYAKEVPKCVQIGDLLLLDLKAKESNPWKRPGFYNEHRAIYIGNNTFVHATVKIVRIQNYSHFYYNWTKNLAFIRVIIATESQRQEAVDWGKNQIGLPYQFFLISPGLV